ncbi:MAG: Fe-S cluster assembly protein HesB [Jatrophihabitans sp.]|nr:MAG: Fe-S cluster assembly protein HesB [Jatrophihabitans sp.]
MYLATTDTANALLERNPFALLTGMLLDQQIPMEKAFTSPQVLRERLGGTLDAATVAGCDPQALEAIFRQPPALHRFPAAMAKRVQELARIIVERYDGDAAAVWTGARSGADLIARVGALPGFGEQKAKIFTALLGKQLAVRPRGWREAAGAYGEDGSARSVADVIDGASLRAVRAFKQEQKAAARARTGG